MCTAFVELEVDFSLNCLGLGPTWAEALSAVYRELRLTGRTTNTTQKGRDSDS